MVYDYRHLSDYGGYVAVSIPPLPTLSLRMEACPHCPVRGAVLSGTTATSVRCLVRLDVSRGKAKKHFIELQCHLWSHFHRLPLAVAITVFSSAGVE